MKGNSIITAAKEVLSLNNSAFIIDLDKFEHNIKSMFRAFNAHYPNVEIGYSYKTNYVPSVCSCAHANGCWAEVVSEMEVDFALHNLPESDLKKIIYNGPVKSFKSIKSVIEAGGIINIDHIKDLTEIKKVLDDCNDQKLIVNLGIRLNFEYQENQSRFGFSLDDIEEVLNSISSSRSYNFMGFHVHLPFRSIESFEFRIESLISILERFKSFEISYLNIGGGFFGQLPDELLKTMKIDGVPSYSDYAKVICGLLTNYFQKSRPNKLPTIFLEPGSSLIADAVFFVSKIHTIKSSGGKNYMVSYAARHLITPTNKNILLPSAVHSFTESEKDIVCHGDDTYHITGYTCIESDIIPKVSGYFNPDLSYFIIIPNVGSYSIVMASDFILPQPSIFQIKGSVLKENRRKLTSEEIYNSFNS